MRNKPLASLCILFYNQEAFVNETLRGALSQTYENLEIIISDDNSTDKTFEIIEKIVSAYKGPHKIKINRNRQNMGLVPHANKIFVEIAKGDYLFIHGGDDISLPERVSVGVDAFMRNPTVTSVTFSYSIISQCGDVIGEMTTKNEKKISIKDVEYLSSPSFMTGGIGLTIRKDVIEHFGHLRNDAQTEDSTWRFRSLLLGDCLWLPNVVMNYRVHENNISKHIFELKTEGIARQYMEDLDRLKDDMPHDICNILFRKVNFYLHYRNLEEKMSQQWIGYKIVTKIKMVILSRLFKFSVIWSLRNGNRQ